MLKNLIKVANRLDTLGLTKEADALDRIIRKVASDEWEEEEMEEEPIEEDEDDPDFQSGSMRATDYDTEGLTEGLNARPIGGSEQSEAAWYEAKSDIESSHRMEEDRKQELYSKIRMIANEIADIHVYGSNSEDPGEEMGLLYESLYQAADAAEVPREMADQFIEEAEKKHKEAKWAERRRSRYSGY